MTGHPQTDQARGIGDGAHVSLSSRPTGMCADGMVDMCRWHGDFAMRYSSGRDPLLIQIALGVVGGLAVARPSAGEPVWLASGEVTVILRGLLPIGRATGAVTIGAATAA